MEQTIQAFLADLKYAHGRAENTLSAYRADLSQFMQVVERRLGRLPPAEMLTPDHVDAYVTWLEEQGYRVSTVARKMAAIRTFLRFAEASSGRATESLLGRLKPPTGARRQTRALTPTEVEKLLAAPGKRGRAIDLRDSAILAILYATGMRAAEVVALDVADVDLIQGVLRGDPGQAGKPLDMAFEPLRSYLFHGRAQLAAGQDRHALFLNQRGGGLSRQGLWLVVKRWAAEVGLGGSVSPHTLRRSRAEHLLEAGRRKRDVQRFLGLSSPNTLRWQPTRPPSIEEEIQHD